MLPQKNNVPVMFRIANFNVGNISRMKIIFSRDWLLVEGMWCITWYRADCKNSDTDNFKPRLAPSKLPEVLISPGYIGTVLIFAIEANMQTTVHISRSQKMYMACLANGIVTMGIILSPSHSKPFCPPEEAWRGVDRPLKAKLWL